MKELILIALALMGNSTNETINNVHDYIYADYGYEFNYYPKGIDQTFLETSGDCTDYSMLANYFFKINNITSQLVHGYAYCPNKVKHDWLMINGSIFDVMECTKHKIRGWGIW